jgi:hypothetical protein
LDKLRDDQTYEVQPDMHISNYTGVFSEKPYIKRILKVRHMRVVLDVSDSCFLDPSSSHYLNPSEPVFCLLVGRSKVIDWRETMFGGAWDVRDDEEFLHVLVLCRSRTADGAFRRIGILDPDPTLDNPNLYHSNDGRHPMVHRSMKFFKNAEKKVVRIV